MRRDAKKFDKAVVLLFFVRMYLEKDKIDDAVLALLSLSVGGDDPLSRVARQYSRRSPLESLFPRGEVFEAAYTTGR